MIRVRGEIMGPGNCETVKTEVNLSQFYDDQSHYLPPHPYPRRKPLARSLTQLERGESCSGFIRTYR
jgi:hypothetical protein|eukprot:COSAG01_NODE_800_length_13475_cov_24.171725_15_plen_67_part_00